MARRAASQLFLTVVLLVAMASADYEVFEAAEDESVIGRIVAAQREEVELKIAGLKAESDRIAEEARELVGEVPF